MSMIIVGIDGSEASIAALEFAAAEAAIRGVSLRAVSAWQIPRLVYAGTMGPGIDIEAFRQAAAKTAHEELVKAVGPKRDDVQLSVHEGDPADLLIREALGAELLVVGSRGRGGFRGLLLGSVSQQCAAYAPCPVVIVHTPSG